MNKKSIIKNVIFVLTILILAVVILLQFDDIESVFSIISGINTNYFILVIFVLIIHWLTWGMSLFLLIRRKTKEISKTKLFLITNTDLFFNGITPFSSGGQPFQLYAFTRSNVKASDATSSLLMNFIIHQLTVNILCILSLVYYNEISRQVDSFIIFVIIGFVINFAILFICLTASISVRIRSLYYKLFDVVCKIKFVNKFIGHKKQEFVEYIEEFQSSFKELCAYKSTLIYSILMRTICMLAYYSIPFVILQSFDLNLGIDIYFYSLALSTFNFAIMSYIPIPGASVGAELGLQTFLLTIAGVDVTTAIAVIVIWRFLTYYLTMFYGFITYVIFEQKNIRKET